MSDLITNEQLAQMVENYRTNAARSEEGSAPVDYKPVVKLFMPTGRATWLLTEYDPDFVFGLCDLGFGFPELGNVALEELHSVVGPFALKADRDTSFQATMTLGKYAEEARRNGGITA
ncbi:DUF2958 domain-containing protein [Phyllobacterium zundukense]|uniref:Uncharacterized protein n=1 Tax=Phyllobacterium zundukense TaxID=1867719 RepID=A0A2N9VYL7_9HYPH|nr:DUF2958 domain-containing protein [Phyllobacterium zundukense]ATU95174.1 hypothetical protein BLM14_25860 [Phyllobacterium zundukense]PIO44585.1 hypothetical protein B5P45_12000 [Phyllobacterium zundukense]